MTESVDLPRYAPELPLPPYAYVPGQTPHPVSDPAGHAYGQSRPSVVIHDPAEIAGHVLHRHAIDLFNHGYYWEAHEAWEAMWVAVGRTGPVADLLKGLIKLAAAGVKLRAGQATGTVRHAQRARELFELTNHSHQHEFQRLGLTYSELLDIAEELSESMPHTEASLAYPVITWKSCR